jgi:hypothetical protein
MPVTGFNIGKEASLDLVHPRAGVIPIALLTSFNAKPMKTRLESKPITNGGRVVYRMTYQGWEGNFEYDRTDDVVDLVFQELETNYYSGLPETYFMITQTIRNPDASLGEYRYINAILEPDDPGTFKGEEKVTGRFGFVAQERVKS